MTTMNAGTHEEARRAWTAYSPSRDDGLGLAPTASELEIEAEVSAAARAVGSGWSPAPGAVRAWVSARP